LGILLVRVLSVDPKPFNPWRLFWLRVFEAKIEGTPFVHSPPRIAIPSNLTLHDRACLGDRANAYSLGEIEIGSALPLRRKLISAPAAMIFHSRVYSLLQRKLSLALMLLSAHAHSFYRA